MGDNIRNRLKTLRDKMLAIPAIVERSCDKTVVKMALHISQRGWVNKLVQNINVAYAGSGYWTFCNSLKKSAAN